MNLKTTHVCVVDFEATCWGDKRHPHDTRINEIIEIGAAMVELRSMEVVGEFGTFIKPMTSKELSDFCIGLTSITQAEVDGAPSFPDALEQWRGWLNTYSSDRSDILFSSWGLYDYKQLLKDCLMHGKDFPFRGDHMNLKEYIGVKMKWSRKGCGMGKALNRLNMPFEGRQHRGINDAKMAAKILLKVGYDAATFGDSYRTDAHAVIVGYPRGS